MNDKGFTLIELLGSMVILGLLMILVVPNVVGILNSNKETVYVEDAKKMVNIAKTKATMKRDFTLPKSNGDGVVKCVFLGLGYLDNSEFDAPPNGGCYDVNRSYVVIQLDSGEYKYYVQLVENKKGKNTGIITPTLSTSITKDTVSTGAAGLSFTYTANSAGLVAGCTEYTTVLTKNGPKTFASDSEGICAK